jgi:hypothetical protein
LAKENIPMHVARQIANKGPTDKRSLSYYESCWMFVLSLSIVCSLASVTFAGDESERSEAIAKALSDGRITDAQADSLHVMMAETPRDRHRFFVPGSEKQTNQSLAIRRKLPEFFSEQAEIEYRRAVEFAEAGDWQSTYSTLFRVIGFDPKHAKASRALENPSNRMKLRKLTAKIDRPIDSLGWQAGSYSQIQTPHFVISSQAPAKVAGEVADICEQAFCLWQQLFFSYWASAENLAGRMNGQDVPLGNTPKFQLVLFKNRDDYIRALKNAETNIEVSTGYYHPTMHCSFFYWGDPRSSTTLRHELVHQFFQEFARNKVALDADTQSDIWIVEGIAMYLESASSFGGVGCDVVEVGGWDAPRVQAARYRRMHDEFWIPWPELRQEVGQHLRSRSDIKFFYSQAAGLAHFWMDDSPAKRDALADYIDSVYAGMPDETLLPEAADDDALRKSYEEFLTVSAEQMRGRHAHPSRREIVLSRMDISTSDFDDWSNTARDLDWLDLSFTKIDDPLFADTEKPWNIRRLNVESTRVTDAALASIGKMAALVELDLSGCPISNAGLKQISGHPRISTLWLTGTQVDDEILPTLQSLKALEYVNLDDTMVTKEGWKKIQAAIPKLRKD